MKVYDYVIFREISLMYIGDIDLKTNHAWKRE